jgi:uncharacterized protein
MKKMIKQLFLLFILGSSIDDECKGMCCFGYDWTELLFTAIRRNDVKTVEKLLRKNKKHHVDEEALLVAVSMCNVDMVRCLLADGRVNVNEKNRNGLTALMIASSFRQTVMVQLLLAHRADVNAQENEKRSALLYASFSGDVGVVKMLLDAGADMTLKDDQGQTALDVARTNGYIEVERLLMRTIIAQEWQQGPLELCDVISEYC